MARGSRTYTTIAEIFSGVLQTAVSEVVEWYRHTRGQHPVTNVDATVTSSVDSQAP